jgi:histone-lysine N-methyltransferase SETMAR
MAPSSISPEENFNKSPSVGKVMITVSCKSEGVILVDAMPRGEAINSDAYIGTLTELRKRFKRVWTHKNPKEIFFQHDNAKLHTSLKTLEAIAKFGWTVLPHPPFSPSLAPSDFHLFGALKDASWYEV